MEQSVHNSSFLLYHVWRLSIQSFGLSSISIIILSIFFSIFSPSSNYTWVYSLKYTSFTAWSYSCMSLCSWSYPSRISLLWSFWKRDSNDSHFSRIFFIHVHSEPTSQILSIPTCFYFLPVHFHTFFIPFKWFSYIPYHLEMRCMNGSFTCFFQINLQLKTSLFDLFC